MNQLSRTERKEAVDQIQQREPHLTRAQARYRLTRAWIGPVVNHVCTISIGTPVPQRRGGGFSVDYQIRLYV